MIHIIKRRNEIPECPAPIVYDTALQDSNFAHTLYSIEEYLKALRTVKEVNPIADISKVLLVIDIIGLNAELVKTRYYSQVERIEHIVTQPNADMIDLYIIADKYLPSVLEEV